jgi:hypothetical protein
MKRVVVAVVAAILCAPGCTGRGPNYPTPGPGVSERCAALLAAYERAKTEDQEHGGSETATVLGLAREKLFESGCLKS